MIPFVFHFSYFRGSTMWKWSDLHTLCILSCHEKAKAEKIIIHYDIDGDGPAWDEVKKFDFVEWRKVSPIWVINGHTVTDQRIAADYFRLCILESEGGFYADLDFVFLKSFETLRHNQAVIGTQCPQKFKLACGLMGAVPHSAFIKAYLESYKEWNPAAEKKFWIHANVIPWNLSKLHPVTVLPRKIFYPLAWSNKTFWTGKPICMNNAMAIHLWESKNPEITKEVLTKTPLGSTIHEMLYGLPPLVHKCDPATISFD